MKSVSKYSIRDDIEIPQDIQDNWQVILDILSEIVGVPTAKIMRVHPHEIEIFGLNSNNLENVYEKGQKALLNTGIYCETVMNERSELLVPHALGDPEWDNNPDAKFGMTSYLGLPLCWPKNALFGTICVLDNKENHYTDLNRRLLGQFKIAIELALKDIFERKETEEKLIQMANYDTLTGLVTRRLGVERIISAVGLARREKNITAVMFLDLDGFKAINDTLGHAHGDRLLKGVAKRLSACVREIDSVVRFGGDEFLIILAQIDSRENVALVAKKLVNAMAKPFKLGSEDVTVSVSIGIAIYPDHEGNPEELIRLADAAMYGVKNRGKNDFSFAK